MADSIGVPGLRYSRDVDEWADLEEAGLGSLIERARLERMMSYAEMNAVPPQRTG